MTSQTGWIKNIKVFFICLSKVHLNEFGPTTMIYLSEEDVHVQKVWRSSRDKFQSSHESLDIFNQLQISILNFFSCENPLAQFDV